MNTSVTFYQLRKGDVEEWVFMFQTLDLFESQTLQAMGFLQGFFAKLRITICMQI